MGYTTTFTGQFVLDRPLSRVHSSYLKAFRDTRRMKRNADLADKLDDDIRLLARLPIGKDGGYFVGGKGMAGQDNDASVLEYNNPPNGQPSLWCHWAPSDNGEGIEWDGGEKFYHYIEWLKYVVQSFLSPWGYTVNGTVEWQGEESDDRGRIVVENNNISSQRAKIVWSDA